MEIQHSVFLQRAFGKSGVLSPGRRFLDSQFTSQATLEVKSFVLLTSDGSASFGKGERLFKERKVAPEPLNCYTLRFLYYTEG